MTHLQIPQCEVYRGLMNTKLGGLVLAVCVCLSGCTERQELTEAKEKIALLEARLVTAEVKHTVLNDTVAALESKIGEASGGNKVAFLSSTGSGYQKVETNVTPLLVSFLKVEPVGSGTKLYIQFGNLSSVALTSAKVTIVYPLPDNAGTKTVTHEVNETFMPGTWTEVAIPLPGIKPDQFEHFSVSAELNFVRLR